MESFKTISVWRKSITNVLTYLEIQFATAIETAGVAIIVLKLIYIFQSILKNPHYSQERYAQQFQYIIGNFGCLWHMVHVWRNFGDHSQIFYESTNQSAFKNVSTFSVSLTPNFDHWFYFHDGGISIRTIFCFELSYGVQQSKYTIHIPSVNILFFVKSQCSSNFTFGCQTL